MPNGMLNDLEFEQRIQQMNDRELLEFTARQMYDVCLTVNNHDSRIGTLENRDKKSFGLASGIGTFIGAVIVAIIDFLTRKGA